MFSILAPQEGYSALHLAITYRYRHIAELLLRQGVAVDTQAADGNTPLLSAVYSRDVKLVDLLLQYSAHLAVADAVRLLPPTCDLVAINTDVV
jgi:ankyrin repeat protein